MVWTDVRSRPETQRISRREHMDRAENIEGCARRNTEYLERMTPRFSARYPQRPQRATLRQFDRRWKRGRPAMLGRLFVGVGETDQLRLAPGAADEGDADWETVNEAGGNGHARITCHRGRRRSVDLARRRRESL